eukprot:11726-Heterococcus_DN1.PRE.4
MKVTARSIGKVQGASGQPAHTARTLCACSLVGVLDCDLHLYSWLNRDRSDLLDDLRGAVQVDDALVDAHLEPVEGHCTVTARRLAGQDPELAGRQADWA